jgi:hypothetical protein
VPRLCLATSALLPRYASGAEASIFGGSSAAKKAIPIARTSANMVIFILKNRRFSPEYCQPASKLQGPQPTPQKKLVLFRRIEQI